MNKILIINPFGIGDVLFTTPLVSNIHRAYPNARIVYIGNTRTKDFLSQNPQINDVLSYDRDEFVAVYKKNPVAFIKKWMDFIFKIRRERFDCVFDFSLNASFGWMTYCCGIPKRIGYDYRGRGRLLTHKITLKGFEGRHVIDYYLDLLKLADIPIIDRQMQLPLTEADLLWAKAWIKDKGIDKQLLIAVIPGGGASWGAQAKNKRWPAEKYGDLVHKIIAQTKAAVILMGDAKEEPLCAQVARLASSPVYVAVGQTSIVQMAALLKQCRLVVLNDGGPLHVAVASQVPTVSIFGPVDEKVYGPYPSEGHSVVKANLACQPCYRQFRQAACAHVSCLSNLSVEDVMRKVLEIL